MKTVTVRRTIKAPIEQVFDLISDNTRLNEFPGVTGGKRTREGSPEKNGVGAMRELRLGGAWFQEEITAYERPSRVDYIIRKSKPALHHRGGSIRLKPVEGGTSVVWTSTFRLAIPLIGGLLTLLLIPPTEKAFGRILAAVEQKLLPPS